MGQSTLNHGVQIFIGVSTYYGHWLRWVSPMPPRKLLFLMVRIPGQSLIVISNRLYHYTIGLLNTLSRKTHEITAINTIELLIRLRWPLAAVVGLLFALTRMVEGIFFDAAMETPTGRTLDPIVWGILAFGAIWVVFSWAIRQEQIRRSNEARMLEALRESNERLELLYEINQRVASSATLDEVLDYAITLPARLVHAAAATIVLIDERGQPYTARVTGIDAASLERARTAFHLHSITIPRLSQSYANHNNRVPGQRVWFYR